MRKTEIRDIIIDSSKKITWLDNTQLILKKLKAGKEQVQFVNMLGLLCEHIYGSVILPDRKINVRG